MPEKSDQVDDVRALAQQYRNGVYSSNRGHYIAAERAESRSRMLGISSAVLGAVVGIAIFVTIQSSPAIRWRIAAGILVTVAAVLSALQTFLDHAQRAAAYRAAGAAYGRLEREFDIYLLQLSGNKNRTQLMDDLSVLRTRIDELGQESPLIPASSRKAALRQLSKSNGKETRRGKEAKHGKEVKDGD